MVPEAWSSNKEMLCHQRWTAALTALTYDQCRCADVDDDLRDCVELISAIFLAPQHICALSASEMWTVFFLIELLNVYFKLCNKPLSGERYHGRLYPAVSLLIGASV